MSLCTPNQLSSAYPHHIPTYGGAGNILNISIILSLRSSKLRVRCTNFVIQTIC